FEAEIPIRERAHRTDVHDIRGKRVVEHTIIEQGDGRMIASIDDGQLIGLGNLLAEAHATRALDAALPVVNHVGTKNSSLAIVNFSDLEPTPLAIVLH